MRRAITLLWALSTAVLSSGAAAAVDFISLPSGLSQNLTLQPDGSYESRVGITLGKGIAVETLHARIFEVLSKQGRSGQVAQAFHVNFEPTHETLGPALVVSVPKDATGVLPGTYSLTLQVTQGKPPSKDSTVQTLVLTLLRPSPTLTVGPTVYIERTQGLWGDPEIVQGNLQLTEESGLANLGPLTFTTDADQKSTTRLITPGLELEQKDPGIDAGHPRKFPVKLTGPVPPGTYTGKINIRSPELSAPTAVNYEVRSRRSIAWLVSVALGGALLGFITRVVLKRAQDLAAASTAASLAVQKLEESSARIEDPAVRAAVAKLLETLDTARSTGDPSQILTATQTVLQQLQTTETTFKQDWDQFSATTTPLQQLVTNPNWILPRSVRAALQLLRAQWDAIADALQHNNITRAKKYTAQLPTGALLELVRASVGWRGGLVEYVAVLDQTPPAMGGKDLERLRAYAAEVKAKAPQDPHPVSADVPTTAADLLQSHGAYTGTLDFFRGMRQGLQTFLDRGRKALARASEPARAQWRTIEATTLAVAQHFEVEPEDFNALSLNAEKVLKSQRDAWVALLERIVVEAQIERITALAQSASWDAMLTEAAKALQIETQLDATMSFAGAPAAPAPDTFALAQPSLDAAPATSSAAPSSLRSPAILTGSADERRLLQRRSHWITAAQTAIVAVLFVAGVAALNVDTWVGTPKEMLTIFLLAFGVDLSADGVVAALRR